MQKHTFYAPLAAPHPLQARRLFPLKNRKEVIMGDPDTIVLVSLIVLAFSIPIGVVVAFFTGFWAGLATTLTIALLSITTIVCELYVWPRLGI